MNFVSSIFAVFLAVTFVLWKSVSLEKGKLVLVAASFFFYAYWYPPYVLLFAFSVVAGYFCAARIASAGENRKAARAWLTVSITLYVGILVLFKYANFFLGSVYYVFSAMGREVPETYLGLILPLGISFYTFQGMSFSIDVFRGRIEKGTKLTDFMAYISFFPQLVAGPIVRATDFLPQLKQRKSLTEEDWRFVIYRISRGYFMKVVIADNIAYSVNHIFRIPPENLSFTGAWGGALFFSIQIFCDFAGYSDIAIGTARLFGFRIKENFINPYIAAGFADFWRRWHISLSTWFRDYVYISLGGNRCSRPREYANIMIVFLVSGIWHGANWTFLFWGLVHGLALLAERSLEIYTPYLRWLKHGPVKALVVLVTLVFVVAAWVPFRSETIAQSFVFWKSMFMPEVISGNIGIVMQGIQWALLFGIFQVLAAFKEKFSLEKSYRLLYVESLIYFVLIIMFPGKTVDFIYFQF